MAGITSKARFAALQWKRGQGYYNAHKHNTVLPWREFRAQVGQEVTIAASRYVVYLISWILHHGREPAPEEVSAKSEVADAILADVRRAVREELARKEDMKTATPAKGKKRSKK